ncbi:MAG: CatA-like O-acetyltransferase, family 3 [Synergistaceae bacterium]
MNYKIADLDSYYRKDIFRHFTQDCRCSVSVTHRLDVSKLVKFSKESGTKFYVNFLYLISKVLNSREDYRMQYLYETSKFVIYDKINPTHYIFHEDTETFTSVSTEYSEDYAEFYANCTADIANAKNTREYIPKNGLPQNNFDASYIPWISYDSLNIELPDGYFHFLPIINWGKYREENGILAMPLTVRLNHATADGYLISKVYLMVEKEIASI